MAHGPDVRCFRPVVVSRYRRPRSHEHSGRQAKVAASSLHTFTPGGSPVFRLRASGTTRGITPPGPDDGVTIFGNARITPHPAGAPDGSRSGASPGPMRSTCAQDRPPPPSGTPGACPPAPPGARPRHGGGNDVTAVCQVPSTEIPPQGTPGPLGPRDRGPAVWDPSAYTSALAALGLSGGMTAGDDAMSSTRPPADGSVPNSPDRGGTRVPDAEFSVSDGCYGARGRVPAASRGGVARGGLGPGTAADGEGCCASLICGPVPRENRESRMLRGPGPPAGALGCSRF